MYDIGPLVSTDDKSNHWNRTLCLLNATKKSKMTCMRPQAGSMYSPFTIISVGLFNVNAPAFPVQFLSNTRVLHID
jgi:hypothetical protein